MHDTTVTTTEIDKRGRELRGTLGGRCVQANGIRQRASLSDPLVRAWTSMMEGDYHGQRWTAWFLWREGIHGTDIHRRMVSVCGNEAPSRRTVYRWLANFNSGVETAAKGVSAGRPATSHTAANVAAVSALILANRRITFDDMQEETGLARGTLQAIVHDDLQMGKVCAQWVPHALTQQQKQKRVDICRDLLALHDADPDDFFAHLVTGDESWFLHDTPEKKNAAPWSGSIHQAHVPRSLGRRCKRRNNWQQSSGMSRVFCSWTGWSLDAPSTATGTVRLPERCDAAFSSTVQANGRGTCCFSTTTYGPHQPADP